MGRPFEADGARATAGPLSGKVVQGPSRAGLHVGSVEAHGLSDIKVSDLQISNIPRSARAMKDKG